MRRRAVLIPVLAVAASCGSAHRPPPAAPAAATGFCATLFPLLLPLLLEASTPAGPTAGPAMVDVGSFVQVSELLCAEPLDPSFARRSFARPVRDLVLPAEGIGSGFHLRARSITYLDPTVEAVVTRTTRIVGAIRSEQFRLHFVDERRRLQLVRVS
jgi:hypothetical protein